MTSKTCKFCERINTACTSLKAAEHCIFYEEIKIQETVHHPSHYGGDTIFEVIKVLEAWLQPEQFIGFLRGNSLKYLARAGKKGENYEEDLRKAIWYANYETEFRKRWSAGLIGENRFEFTEKKPNP